MLGKSNFVKRCNRIPVDKKRSEPQILEANVDMFRTHGVVPGLLESGMVPVDIDVTPMDNSKSHKAGVSRTYKGFDGYAPPMAYIGTEGFLINTELHEGKQHCQKGMPPFLEETLRLSHEMTNQQLLIRMDSGNDARENLGILLEDGDWFIVKRNIRRGESKEYWLNLVRECCPVKPNHLRPKIAALVGGLVFCAIKQFKYTVENDYHVKLALCHRECCARIILWMSFTDSGYS